MVRISRIFLSRPLICRSHTWDTKLPFARSQGNLQPFGGIAAANFLLCANERCGWRWALAPKLLPPKLLQKIVGDNGPLHLEPSGPFFVYYVFNVFYVLLCFKTCF